MLYYPPQNKNVVMDSSINLKVAAAVLEFCYGNKVWVVNTVAVEGFCFFTLLVVAV